LNNGLLPVVVSDEFLQTVLKGINTSPNTPVIINLEDQTITFEGKEETFDINPYKKSCMINGYDDIDYLLSLTADIKKFDIQQS
jgi:3-isopropylmalate/(R)-2-methylmalate dehydratase small subunit